MADGHGDQGAADGALSVDPSLLDPTSGLYAQPFFLAAGVTRVYTPKDFEMGRIMADIAELAIAHRGG